MPIFASTMHSIHNFHKLICSDSICKIGNSCVVQKLKKNSILDGVQQIDNVASLVENEGLPCRKLVHSGRFLQEDASSARICWQILRR